MSVLLGKCDPRTIRAERSKPPVLAATLAVVLLGSGVSGEQADVPPTVPPGTPGIGAIWQGGEVNLDSFYPVPGNGGWTDSPVILPDPGWTYRYELACLGSDGDSLRPGCVASQCTAADDGQAVIWERAPSQVDDPMWERVGGTSCLYSEEPIDVMELIAGDILEEFRSLSIDAGAVSAQPSPHTLRTAHTNFFATATEQVADFELHDQGIHLRAWPVQYEWNYDDGSAAATFLDPGGPIASENLGEQTQTSHQFAETGDYAVQLSVTYRAVYQVNGGVEIPVPGDATFTAAPLTVSVWRSVVNNFADNCLENPNGAGC